MNVHRIGAALGIFLALHAAGQAATWNSSFETARQQSQASGRPILVNFTGSDWCPACIQLRNNVLSSQEFGAFAEQNLVLLEIDFPRGRAVPAAQRQANEELARKYGIEGFPTVLVLDAAGKVAGQISHAAPKDKFILAAEFLARKAGGNPTPVARRATPTVRDLPLFGGAATKPLPTYTNLIVKSISGTPARRFALINSETLAAGDSAWFVIGGQRVQVHCVAIQEKSVRVKIHGEPAERDLLLSEIRH